MPENGRARSKWIPTTAAVAVVLGVPSIGVFLPDLRLALDAVGVLGYLHFGRRAAALWLEDELGSPSRPAAAPPMPVLRRAAGNS